MAFKELVTVDPETRVHRVRVFGEIMGKNGRMSEYERERAANIARNKEMLAQLGVKRTIQELKILKPSSKKKTPSKSYKLEKKKPSSPLRRSLRNRGEAPELEGLTDEVLDTVRRTQRSHQRAKGVDRNATLEDKSHVTWSERVPFSTLRLDVDQPDVSFTEILKTAGKSNINTEKADRFNPRSLKLQANDVAKVVLGKVLSMTFLPTTRVVLLAGDSKGHIGVWDADRNEDSTEDKEVQVYQPHASSVTTLATMSSSPEKIASCSYDGYVLLMDLDKMVFSRIHDDEQRLTAMFYRDVSTFYIGLEEGDMKVIDMRSSSVPAVYNLHDKQIQTIDFSSSRPYDVATASADGTVAIWDVRKVKDPLTGISHRKSVHSAYFSPSGDRLVTTSYDDHVGLWSGKEHDEPVMIRHNNQTNRWIATFRAIWSCTDNYVFMANMGQAIDVISTRQNRVEATLRSQEMTIIPSRLAQHRVLPGVVAGGSAAGKVYLWRS